MVVVYNLIQQKMTTLKTIQKNSAAFFAAGLTALVIAAPVTGFALAKNNKDGNRGGENNQKNVLSLKIGHGGDVQLAGLRVTSVSAGTITASATWQAGSIIWTILTDATTKISGRNDDDSVVIANVAVGDVITVSGELKAVAPLTALAERIRILKDVSPARTTIQGTLVSALGTSLPTSLVLRSGGLEYVVRLTAETVVLNGAWMRIPFANFRVGDMVRAYGIVTMPTRTVDATVVRDVSL